MIFKIVHIGSVFLVCDVHFLENTSLLCTLNPGRRQGLRQYITFMNDHNGYGPVNARTLMAKTLAVEGGGVAEEGVAEGGVVGVVKSLVEGWKPVPTVTKGGAGSIQMMFKNASAKQVPRPQTRPPGVQTTSTQTPVPGSHPATLAQTSESHPHRDSEALAAPNAASPSGKRTRAVDAAQTPTSPKKARGSPLLKYFGKKAQ